MKLCPVQEATDLALVSIAPKECLEILYAIAESSTNHEIFWLSSASKDGPWSNG